LIYLKTAPEFFGGLSISKNEIRKALLIKDKEIKLQDMLFYCTQALCRSSYIRKYFNESAEENCGCCDLCDRKYKEFVSGLTEEPLTPLSSIVKLHGNYIDMGYACSTYSFSRGELETIMSLEGCCMILNTKIEKKM